jgi:hypothetical protein
MTFPLEHGGDRRDRRVRINRSAARRDDPTRLSPSLMPRREGALEAHNARGTDVEKARARGLRARRGPQIDSPHTCTRPPARGSPIHVAVPTSPDSSPRRDLSRAPHTRRPGTADHHLDRGRPVLAGVSVPFWSDVSGQPRVRTPALMRGSAPLPDPRGFAIGSAQRAERTGPRAVAARMRRVSRVLARFVAGM